MTIETIDIGAVANDGTGDTLRTAGTKINSNFSELAEEARVFTYLPASITTVCATADQWYDVDASTFNRVFLDNFSAQVDGIQYDGLRTRKFHINASITAQADKVCRVHYAAFLNGVLIGGSTAGARANTPGDTYHISANVGVELSTGDTLKLVVSSDAANTDITTNHYSVTVNS